MKQGGAPPRKRKRREAAAETETEAEHPGLSTVTEAEHPDLSTVTEAERRSPRCWLLDRVGGELAERDRLLAERKRLLAERDRQIAWKETKIREMQAHIKDIHAMQLRLGLCLSSACPAALALKRKTGIATTPLTPRSWGPLGALRGRGWCVHAM
jgi:hypothetical protein